MCARMMTPHGKPKVVHHARFCNACGNRVAPADRYCANCGRALVWTVPMTPPQKGRYFGLSGRLFAGVAAVVVFGIAVAFGGDSGDDDSAGGNVRRNQAAMVARVSGPTRTPAPTAAPTPTPPPS
jgi:hypothetical protein